jgi:TRAP-type C4-dicarboxylate transport system permease small subunit
VGVGVALPGNTEVQPATRSAATSATIPIPQMVNWFFMNYPACGDIRCGRYLWIYLTAKFLGVMVFFINLIRLSRIIRDESGAQEKFHTSGSDQR